MGIVDNALMGASGQGGYFLTRSLRFRSSASAYLNRTPAGAGNRKTWTWSGWVKRGNVDATQKYIFVGGTSNAVRTFISFNSSNGLTVYSEDTSVVMELNTTQVFRDPSAWYHIVVAIDTTQTTASNRVKIYVNGLQVTALSTATYPTLNTDLVGINTTNSHFIGVRGSWSLSDYFDGYLAEVNFIDGQALTPSSFGSTNALTGVWQPAKYVGTYGTNGFYLPFTDNSALTTSSNVGLGKDFSGNGNYWTTNNISLTSGVTYDSMTDVPTLTSATAANFAVLNPLAFVAGATGLSATNGNLTYNNTNASNAYQGFGSMSSPSGKFYFEVTITARGDSSDYAYVGANNTYYANTGRNQALASFGAAYTTGDVIGVAIDTAVGVTYYKNNVSQGTISTTTPTVPFCAGFNSAVYNFNFGQRPFTYTPPTGFVALNTYNLPTSTIVKGNTVMDATLYTGNGSAQTIVNAAGFKPDFIWQKARAEIASHRLVDSVRGTSKVLYSNLTNSEATTSGVVDSFNTNGFTGGGGDVVSSGLTAVAWQWQAGQGSTSSNTSGSITSTVSVNASAGFSVATFTMPTSGVSTFGHGLGVAPQLVILKARTGAIGWGVYHVSVGNGGYLQLNNTSATAVDANAWNNTSPTSSVFTIGTSFNNLGTYVAYCWTPIAGYSAFGSYTGNGGTDGPFVYTGFRPKLVITKRTDSTSSWYILDTSRSAYNAVTNSLYPDLSNAEVIETSMDILSNGFKLRNNFTGINASGGTYIYMAFAENPFKNALAR
jgi:hypothetical protein